LPEELEESDLRQKDLWEIWFEEGAFAYTRQFSIDELGPSCEGCDMAEQCKGGCSAMSYACSRTFRNDPYCLYGLRRRETQDFQQSMESGRASPRE
jgi:radical SAM protein with 4Fe4S-binding SPASM domain